MPRTSASARPLTDHEEIRQWAEQRGAKPTCVRGTGGGEDVGMIRLDFPGFTGPDKLQEIAWDEWFEKFDESGLALLVQEQTARGQRSNFNKLVSRETAAASEGNRSSRPRGRRSAGTSNRSGSRSGLARNQKSTKSRSSSRSRGKVTSSRSSSSRSGRSAKKSPSRVRTTSSATARGRNRSRRRAA